MEEIKKCPYCGEEILATAKKCKHCGEWLNEEELAVAKENDDELNEYDSSSHGSNGILGRIFGLFFGLVIAFSLFKFGGWDAIWAHEFTNGERTLIQMAHEAAPRDVITDDSQSFIFYENVLLVRVNQKFYGVVKNTKYFDSPLIQWIMLIGSIGSIIASLKMLFQSGEKE